MLINLSLRSRRLRSRACSKWGDATCSPRVRHTHLAAGTVSLLQAFKGALDDRLCLYPGAGGLTQQVEEFQE
jgi:hypothetical protein